MPTDRQNFIDKEKDQETAMGGMLSDFGVRKYDEGDGRFMSIDPLWEKYRAWTPYHYAANNPVFGRDPSGEEVEYGDEEIATAADPSAQQAARTEVRMNEEGDHSSVMSSVMLDSRTARVQFGKPAEGAAGQVLPQSDNDGNISRATLLIDRDRFMNMTPEARIKFMAHEFKHIHDLFSAQGPRVLSQHKRETEDPNISYFSRTMEQTAIRFAARLMENYFQHRSKLNESDTPIKSWWNPRIAK